MITVYAVCKLFNRRIATNTMRALLIDDEQSNRVLLNNMLKKHCPGINILGDADSASLAYQKIKELKPDLIFLDIKMQNQNGFDLLRQFDNIDFSIIFVTGFDEYAIKAFEFNAVDYILKPLDHSKLISAVQKAEANHYASSANVIRFVHSLEEKTNYIKKIAIHGKDKVHVIDLNHIVHISADRGYSEIFDINKQRHISAKPLSDYEELLKPFKNFIRVNKSSIINSQHLHSYTKGSDCVILMNDCDKEFEVSRRKKTEILMLLK
jgi:two-component system, LytTR family, response regulator